ncbi:13892_t:CDS:1, partial [Racocetra fulgida]
LWRKPFSYDNEWNNLYKIIPIYLSFLSEETKFKHGIQEISIPTIPFIDYVSYIRELDLYSLLLQLCEWMVKSKFINTRPRILTETDDFDDEDPIIRLICQDMTEKISLKRTMYIIKEIIMIIVERSTRIDYLEITMGNMDGIVFDYLDSEYFVDIFNAIPPNWFANISKLEYDGRHLLERFTEHAPNIKSLSFGFHTFTQKLISKISSLISFQNNLVDLDIYLGYNEDYIESEINISDISEVILTLIEKVHSLKSLSLASGGN